MSDYGLEELTDDQVVDLLQAVLQDILRRDVVAIDAAQRVVTEQAAKAKLVKTEILAAIEAERNAKLNALRTAAREEVRKLNAAGIVRLVDDERAEATRHLATINEQIAVIDEALNQAACRKLIQFFVQVDPSGMYLGLNKQVIKADLPPPNALAVAFHEIKKLLGRWQSNF